MPVFQRPLIHHILDYHYKAGINSFIINISHLADMWEKYFPETTWHGCPLHFSREESPLDSGGGIKKIMSHVRPDEPLLVQNGDIMTDLPLRELLDAHRAGGRMVTLALRSRDGNKNVGFDPESGRITDMRHALGVDRGSYQFAGVYAMEPAIADLFPEGDLFSIVPVWLELIRRGEVGGAVFDDADWYEIGSPKDYLDGMLDMHSIQRIHPTAKIATTALLSPDCVVGAEVVIPERTVLHDCLVWPRTHVKPGLYERCILTPRMTIETDTASQP